MRKAERVEFEWIFRSTYSSVLRTTYLVLHDRGRAEEVTQDAFLRLYERWRGVSPIEHPEAWVRRVAVRDAVLYGVDQVLTDPCRRRTATDVGPTVDDLARAVVGARGPSTQPRQAELDGRPAVYLEVTVPPSTDLDTCTNGEYPLFAARGDFHAHSDPGVVHHLWVVDVEGTRLVVVASTYPDQSDSTNDGLLAIAESIHFQPADS